MSDECICARPCQINNTLKTKIYKDIKADKIYSGLDEVEPVGAVQVGSQLCHVPPASVQHAAAPQTTGPQLRLALIAPGVAAPGVTAVTGGRPAMAVGARVLPVPGVRGVTVSAEVHEVRGLTGRAPDSELT